ncbi:threonine aldolase [Reichenbachiella sp. 5M10]|nr:threonine aldolase [Reichenbachiella sp. 5M10]
MLEAMLSAQVGDDVFGEDPTVIRLENRLAEYFGKEAGLFCPSGTMANQIAIKINTQPGDQLICDQSSHIYHYEGGGAAFNSGVSLRMIAGDHGRFTAEDVLQNINANDIHFPKTALVCIENTSNKGGGSIWSIDEIKRIAQTATLNQLRMHLDGARIFHALTETKDDPLILGKYFNTLSICLSKGLGAPAGSVLLGSQESIQRAKRVRKIFGGAMRQIGYLAAAGLYALDHHIDRLSDDHRRAEQLAHWLGHKPYVKEIVYAGTNIVILKLNPEINEEQLLLQWKEKGILAVPFGKGHIRLVTHLDFNDQDMKELQRRI